jgi:hypothetical protein
MTQPADRPFPDTEDELRVALWSHLQEKVRERADLGAEAGQRAVQDPSLRSRGSRRQVKSEISLNGEGLRLVCALFDLTEQDAVHHVPIVQHRIENVVHELVHVGILRPAAAPNPNREFFLTPHGMRCLNDDALQLPLLPDGGRADKLLADNPTFPGIDTIVTHYREAIGAYMAKLDLSATVMIGACYEATENELAKAIVRHDGQRENPLGTGKALKAVTAGEFATSRAVTRAIDTYVEKLIAASPKGVRRPKELVWAQEERRALVGFTQYIRNRAGHPTGNAIDRDRIARRLLLLDEHLQAASGFLDYLT